MVCSRPTGAGRARDLAADDDDDDEEGDSSDPGSDYDAGTVFGRGQRPTRRHLDERVMRRELDVIRDELHATHVRVVASDPARLDTVAAAVAEARLGLQCVSPSGLDSWVSRTISSILS